MRYVQDEPKVYEAIVKFGSETDTEDPHGKIVRESALPSRAALESSARAFVGTFDQVPPVFSAKQIDGERSYDLARAGKAVALAPVSVTVHACALSAFEGTDAAVTQCAMHVSCAGGTYVRSIARDLARAAGTAAHLVALRRVSAGSFAVSRANSLEALQAGAVAIEPPLAALLGYPQYDVSIEQMAKVGRGLDIPAENDGALAALVSRTNESDPPILVAFAERTASAYGERWQPRVVMIDA